jgi:FtsH-binding integral membrane protein
MPATQLTYPRGQTAVAADASVEARKAFIRRTYGHLAAAILAFVAIEGVLFASGVGQDLALRLFSTRGSMLLLLVLFIGGAFAAQAMARSTTSVGLQYAGLSMYVMLEVVIFLPLLYRAEVQFPGQHVALTAGIVTLLAFGGLTLGVFVSGKDFSFLGPILWVLALASLGLIVAGLIFNFSLGLVFAYAMVLLASGFIIYDTSNVIHHYRTDQHVAAALALFASVALMFWYVLRIFLGSRSE